jgi:serine/threonine protein kinase
MEVAIKATRNMIDEKPDMARERILQEGRLFWLLKHENIIPLHGICLEEPNMCLIMEYARGGPLNRILGNGRRIRPVRDHSFKTSANFQKNLTPTLLLSAVFYYYLSANLGKF